MEENTIINLLNQANGTNLNNESRKAATKQLIQIQSVSGYPSTLLKVWQSSQPDTLREIALVQFKNHAMHNFKQTGNNQEKEHCKNLLLNTYLNEKSDQICKQISQCIAKLARREWPSNWSSLFEILVNNLKNDDANCVLRTALIITDILQEINSMRLPQHRAETNKLCLTLMPLLFEIWRKAFAFSFSQFENQTNCDLNKLYQCLKLCLFLSKSIKILMRKSSNVDFSHHSVMGEYMNKTLDVIQKLHDQYYRQLLSISTKTHRLKDMIECVNDILKTLLKTVRDCHLEFTLQFRLILPSYLSYYTHLILRNKQRQNKRFILNEVIVYALLFIYDVCKQPQYKGKDVSGIQFNNRKIVFNQTDANECKLIVTNFFSKDRLNTIVQSLVSDLFVLTRQDLEDRSIDPCAKWQQQHIEHNNDNIRAAAKQLFRILVKNYKDICAPIVVEMFKSIAITKSNVNMNTNINYKNIDPENAMYRHFFLKEAIYLAIGLKYWDISPYFAQFGCKFNDIGEILSADLKLYGRESGYKIPFLCARILWLFGQLKEDINKNSDTKQYVYNAILTHLEPINDSELSDEVLLLRLDASEALYNLLDDSGFEVREYSHLLQRTFSLLLKLVSDCDGSLECMQDILRYIALTIKQNASTLSNSDDNTMVNSVFVAMGICWDGCNSTETNLCRVKLIECITHLCGCMKPVHVHQLYPKLIPMIAYCTESTDDDSRICLIDAGLELWHSVLYHSYKLENEMNALFSLNWISQMKTNADFFDILMSILKSYLFIGGAGFVQRHAEDIGETLTCVVADVMGLDDSFTKVTDVLCVFVQLFPNQSPEFLFSVIQLLVKEFIKNDEAMLTPVRCECFMLFFCRLLLVNCDATLAVFESIQQKENNSNLIQTLFECMFSAKNSVKQFYKQKIVVLALLKIFRGVTANDNKLLLPLWTQLLPWFLRVIKETEIECLEFAEDMHPEMDDGVNIMEWTEADRMSNLYCNDIVSHTFMCDVVFKTLNQTAQKINISMDILLKQIAANQQNTNNTVIKDCKYCNDKYNEYLKTKHD